MCWNDICTRFTGKYASNRALARTPEGLGLFKQEHGEKLQTFRTRFNKDVDKSPDLVPDVQLVLLRRSLQPGPQTKLLTKGLTVTLDEFQSRASKYISLEDSES